MSSQLVTVTFSTQNLDLMKEFYNALGANLQVARVDKGSQMLRGQLGSLELILHSIVRPGEKQTPRVSLRFELAGIDEIWKRVKTVPSANVILDLENMPTGKSFVVIDPDGHSIEIFERWKDTADSKG